MILFAFYYFLPDVCRNFIYKKHFESESNNIWSKLKAKIATYFASNELSISYSLQRHFYWYKNVLFAHQCTFEKTLVILAEKDQIVPSKKIKDYLLNHNNQNNNQKIDIIFNKNFGHSDFISSKKIFSKITKFLDQCE